MRRLLLVVVLIALAAPAAAQQITYTDDYKFPLIPRGYKQYWDVQYNAAMNTLEVLFTRTSFVDRQNTFTQKQTINNDLEVIYNLVAGGNLDVAGNAQIDGVLTTGGSIVSGGDISAFGAIYLGEFSFANKKLSIVDTDTGASTLEITFNSGVFGLGVIGTEARSILSSDSPGDLKTEGSKIWTVANDGPGSGLDADLIDGKHASELLGGEVEEKVVVDEETLTRLYRFDFASNTGAVRFDVNILAALEDGTSAVSGEWFFIATKAPDGTILISDVQTKDNFDSPALNASQKKLDNISFTVSLYAGALVDMNILGATSGSLDPNKFLCSFKIKKNRM